jgi:hypothetical protein
MVLNISENYFEAIRQDTMSEYLNIKLQLSQFIYHLMVFDTCTTGNSIKLIFLFHSYVLQQRELSFYTKNLPRRTVCKMHKWTAQNVDLLQIASDSITALVSHIWFY